MTRRTLAQLKMPSKSLRFAIVRLLFAGVLVVACDKSTGPRTGSLTVTISGLPADIAAAVSIVGPGPTTLTATATHKFESVPAGTYLITASNAASDKSTFAPSTVTHTVEVLAGDTPAEVSFSYSVITAIASVSISGVPAGLTPSVTLSNASGFSKTITSSGDVGNLQPGAYTISATALDGDEAYAAVVEPSSLNLSASVTPVPVAIAYAATTGSLRLSVSGLPQGGVPSWEVSSQGGFFRNVTGSGELVVSHLLPGEYTVVAKNVNVEGETYGAPDGSRVVTVTAGKSTAVASSYILRPPSLNLTIDRLYLTQASQTLSGTVPLVAERDTYLRVFVRANESNAAVPPVRVRFYRNGALVSTKTITSPRGDVPTSVNEQNAADSWGMTIERALIQPGTSIIADVDPDNTVREAVESDNQFPASGTAKLLDIRTVSPVNLSFIPITTTDGVTGNVSASRLGELMNITSRMHPVGVVTGELRATYSSSWALAKGDTNNAWVRILSEIETLRVAEGTGRQYVGVLKDNFGSGIAGIGYAPGKSVVIFDESYVSETLAHELGHNWGRRHAPCGGPSFLDFQFPYPDGNIGVFGFDTWTNRILTPDMPDVMSYCWLPLSYNLGVPRRWASDYTYQGVLNFRASFGDAPVADARRQECMIVWGRMTANGLVLEPSFVTTTVPSVPARGGRFSVRALDLTGNAVLALSFDPTPVADVSVEESHFAFAIPTDRFPVSRVASMELAGGGLASASMTAKIQGEALPSVSSASVQAGVRLRWDARENPLLVVRDRLTRQILAFARSGDAIIRTQSTALDVTASNGVQSRPVNLQVRQ